MQGKKCTCTSAARRDAWHLGMIDPTPMGVIYGWVTCSMCGASWRTSAKYIRHIDGAAQFRERFKNEDMRVLGNLRNKVNEIDQEIERLQAARQRYVKQYNKRKDALK